MKDDAKQGKLSSLDSFNECANFKEAQKWIFIFVHSIVYSILSMLEEAILLPKQSSKWYSQKSVLIETNKQVIKLIKDKLIPLSKNKYGRLQKNHHAVNKEPFCRHASEENIIRPNRDEGQYASRNLESKIYKGPQHQTTTVDMKINRLKNVRDLQLNTRLITKNGEAGRCWQILRQQIAQSQKIKELGKQYSSYLDKDGYRSSRSRKKRQNLIQLAERAEKYLRQRKKKLKEEYRQLQQDYYGIRGPLTNQSDIDHLLSQLKKPARLLNSQNSKSCKATIDEQMKREIIQDIHEQIFEQKMNRIKKEMNHKKLVQMR